MVRKLPDLWSSVWPKFEFGWRALGDITRAARRRSGAMVAAAKRDQCGRRQRYDVRLAFFSRAFPGPLAASVRSCRSNVRKFVFAFFTIIVCTTLRNFEHALLAFFFISFCCCRCCCSFLISCGRILVGSRC